jgi:lipoprotein signal peptidase
VIRILSLLAGTAGAVAALDLAQKAFSISERGGAVIAHNRSGLYVATGAVAAFLWGAAVARVGSPAIAVAGGVILGGAVGNLFSIALWPSLVGVPDPLVAGGVAFSVGDVAVGFGILLLIPATVIFALQNRERLFEPV